MTARMIKRGLLTLVAGSALAIAPLSFATVAGPAIGRADDCVPQPDAQGGGDKPCGNTQAQGTQAQGLSCPDGTIVDDKNNKCVSLTEGITKQLAALPPLPALSGGGGGGALGLGKIPSLATVNLPDIVLPSVGLDLVPNLNLNLRPNFGFGGVPSGAAATAAGVAAAEKALPTPKPPKVNPRNPLGLPPPPDLFPFF